MATFSACVRNQRKDGYYPVYIRISHKSAPDYIKTDKLVNAKGLTKSKDIKDPFVVKYCADRIAEYIEKLNKVDIRNWTVKDVKAYLLTSDEDICFSDYARKYYAAMFNAGQERNARNYELAFQHLERFAGTTKVMFSHLTSSFINSWISSLSTTKRAKEMYPICVRQIFKAALLKYNDYDNGIIRIKTNPWPKVKIPEADAPEKRAISPEECRRFFSTPIPESKMKEPLSELGRDVAMMVLCLAGINTVDIFELKKTDYENGVIKYKRAKTKRSRADGAYIEMRVPAIIHPLFEKYLNRDNDTDWLFSFHKRHSTSDSFGANVNIGIKQICKSLGMEKEDYYCVYTFRHTWGTVAQNDCGASISEVAFAMNHSSGHQVTRGYLKIDFTPAWELNEKVVNFIFFTEENGSRGVKNEAVCRLSPKYLVRGEMYFRGRLLCELEDIGFNNKDEVINALAQHIPDDIPLRSMLQFRIVNVDKGQEAIYERMKGGSV